MESQSEDRFPRQIEVTSPAIDSLSSTAQRLSNWLHSDLREILRPLQTLPELPKILTNLKEVLVQQLHHLLVGQVAVQMKAREANIRVAQHKAELVERHLEKKQQQLKDATQRIESRYAELAQQATKQHEGYLRELDSHAYELIERIYPVEIQERFSVESHPYWRALAAHATESAVLRSACLHEGYEAARSEVESYLEKCDAVRDQLNTLTTYDVRPGPLELPYYFAVVEDTESGERCTLVFFPWELDDSTTLGLSVDSSLRRLAERRIDLNAAAPITFQQLSALGEELKKQGVPHAEILRFSKDCGEMISGDLPS